jgi:hypothetical protein
MVFMICILLLTKSYYDYQIRESVMGGPYTRSTRGGDERLNNLVWKLKERRLLRSSRHRCDDNIEMSLKETGNEVVNWINLVEDGAV